MSRTARCLIPIIATTLVVSSALAGGPRHHPRRAPSDRTAFQVTFRTGEFEPDGDSDIWEENVDLYGLTADGAGDWTYGVEFGALINDWMEVLVGLDYYSGEDASYRFVDTNGVPIVLANDLSIAPVTGSLKVMPIGRYGRDGRFRRVVPYLGVGLGFYFWDYEEYGDFIDPVTDVVITGVADADGIALGTHAFAGIEVAFTPAWSVLFEWRRSFVDDDLGSLFEGFGEIDLSGESLTVGASFRF